MLLKNATTLVLDPPSIVAKDLRIRDGEIVEAGTRLSRTRGEEVVDLEGRYVMPGLVCAHTHLYSTLSRGMPPPSRPPENFLDILRSVWWKLDRALDEDAIYSSALVGGIEALLCGTTTIVDHHASPRCIHGSLDIIREALAEVGVRGVLCYEVTDRGGARERDQGLLENERFLHSAGSHPFVRGMVGAHAAFTLSDHTLRRCGEMADHYCTGVHIHAAEDYADISSAAEDYQTRLADRLLRNHVVNEHSILAHCVHFSRKDFEKLRREECWMVHNPRSNMNNRVGHAALEYFGDHGALGTDGFRADMFEESRCAFFKNQESGDKDLPVSIASILAGGNRMVSHLFRRRFGSLNEGSVADLVVLRYFPPTPLTRDTLTGHFLFGMDASMVDSVMVGGKWRVRKGNVVGFDPVPVYEKASRIARKLWKKMTEL